MNGKRFLIGEADFKIGNFIIYFMMYFSSLCLATTISTELFFEFTHDAPLFFPKITVPPAMFLLSKTKSLKSFYLFHCSTRFFFLFCFFKYSQVSWIFKSPFPLPHPNVYGNHCSQSYCLIILTSHWIFILITFSSHGKLSLKSGKTFFLCC